MLQVEHGADGVRVDPLAEAALADQELTPAQQLGLVRPAQPQQPKVVQPHLGIVGPARVATEQVVSLPVNDKRWRVSVVVFFSL